MLKTKIILYIAFFIILLQGCMPQAYYLNIDEQSNNKPIIPNNITDITIFPVTSSNFNDSTIIVMAALGVAEKFEKDRLLPKESIKVYTLPKSEFVEANKEELNSKDYALSLMAKTGAENQIYLQNLKFGKYTVQELEITKSLGIYNLVIPYWISITIYNPAKDSILYTENINGNINLQVDGENLKSKELNRNLLSYLPDIAKTIGEQLATILSPQWETKEIVLITYPEDKNWDKAVQLAEEFKFEQAINIWMQLSQTQNIKKSAYAAYNIALACQILENYKLAQDWINFGLKKYSFKELVLLQKKNKEPMDVQENNN